ncbi:MAG: TolC family protein [Vampirovibrio sp.]|nr:TolC family protein [Vampirovibrio sp.]
MPLQAIMITLVILFAGQATGYLVAYAQPVSVYEDPLDTGETFEKAPAIVHLKGILTKTEAYPVDLPSVLKLVDEQNLLVQRSRFIKRRDKNRLYKSIASSLPDITGSFTQSRFRGAIQVFGGQTIDVIRPTIQSQLGASWTIHPGGKRIYEMLAARRRVKAAKLQVYETRQAQMARAAEEYYTLVEAYLNQEAALKSLEEAEAQKALNKARLTVGVGTKLDLIRAEAQAAERELDLLQAENQIALAEQALLRRLNLDTSIQLEPLDADAVKHRLVDDTTSPDELMKVAVTSHPSLERLRQELKAASSDYKAVRSDILPSINLSTVVSRTGPQYNETFYGRFAGVTATTNLLEGLGMAVPARMWEKRRDRDIKQTELEEQLRTVQTAVVNGLLNSKTFNRSIDVTQKQYDAANEGFRLAVGRYKAGVGIQLDVLNAQTDLIAARSALIQATQNFNRAQVQLLEAIGRISLETLTQGLPPKQEGATDQ